MNHKCKRFKTVLKRDGIRFVVACRECGKKVMVDMDDEMEEKYRRIMDKR